MGASLLSLAVDTGSTELIECILNAAGPLGMSLAVFLDRAQGKNWKSYGRCRKLEAETEIDHFLSDGLTALCNSNNRQECPS